MEINRYIQSVMFHWKFCAVDRQSIIYTGEHSFLGVNMDQVCGLLRKITGLTSFSVTGCETLGRFLSFSQAQRMRIILHD